MKKIVAVDIGACLTKITVAEDKHKQLKILSFKYFPTPYRKDDVFDEEVFFERLFTLVSHEEMKSAQVAVGLASPTTSFSFFELPPMASADLKRAIVSEAKRTIRPAPTESDILRYVILKNLPAKESKQVNVLAGSGVVAEINRYYQVFERQSISPSFIGSSASSPMVYTLGYYADLPASWCFIDIGYTNTTIIIFLNNIPVLVRTILYASRDFIRAIAAEKKISEAQAQEAFLRGEAQESVNASWDYLISEIRRSFVYYKEISAGKIIEGVYFTGGIFSAGPYIDNLKKNIGGKVELFNVRAVKKISLENIVVEESANAGYFFANSLGLVLSLYERKQSLNFLPETALKEKQTQIVKSLSRQVLAISIFGLAVILCLLLLRLASVKGKLKSELASFSEPEYQQAVSAEKEVTQIENQVNAQADFISAQVSFSELRRKVFALIAKYIPSNAYLTTSEFGAGSGGSSSASSTGRRGSQPAAAEGDGETIKCEGRIQGTYEDTTEQVKIFVNKLRKSGLFADVKFERPALGDDEPFLPYGSDFTQNVRREFTLELKLK